MVILQVYEKEKIFKIIENGTTIIESTFTSFDIYQNGYVLYNTKWHKWYLPEANVLYELISNYE